MNTIDEIAYYCDEPNTVGALLITGKWGCGKTYLIENELEKNKAINENYHVLRISLFGETSTESIIRKVKKKMLTIRALSQKGDGNSNQGNPDKKVGTVKKIIQILSQIAGAITPIGNAVNALVSVDITDFTEIVDEIKGKKVLLVFDDLERSKLPPEDLLGCINEFVENYQIKTIIIANEEKIKKAKDQANVSEKTKANEKASKEPQVEEQLKTALSKYDELKEKVVSRTVRLKPNYKSIIAQIVEEQNYENIGYKAFLENRKALIEQIFIESKTENIRSLKCALQGFERVYKITWNQSISDDATENFFSAYLCLLFEYKKGKLEKDEKYGCIFPITQMGEVYTAFQSRYVLSGVLDWVVDGIWEEQAIIAEIQTLGKDKENATPSEMLLMMPVLALTDEQLQTGFREALETGYSGELSLREYQELVAKIANCSKHALGVQVEVDYKRLLSGLRSRMDRIISGEVEDKYFVAQFYLDFSEILNDDQKQIYEELIRFKDEQYSKQYKCKFLQAYKEGDMQKIIDLLRNNNYLFDKEMAEAVSDYYKTSEDQASRFQFVSSFVSMYSKTIFADEEAQKWQDSYDGMKLLKESVERIEWESITGKSLNNQFIEKLSEIINRLYPRLQLALQETKG